jgi:hypothetical protein
MYSELTIGLETYKLRLTTKASIQLEKALGYNPLMLLMQIDEGVMPKLNDVLIILQGMLQTYHHGMNLEKVYDLYDRYVAEGKGMFDLIPLFVEVFENSGYITKNTVQEENEKNLVSQSL